MCAQSNTAKQDVKLTTDQEAWRKQICPVLLFVICRTFILYSLPDTLWLSILSIKRFYNLIHPPPIETKVLLYWEDANQMWKACIRVKSYSQSSQNIRLICGCLYCNRKYFVSGFTFPFHSIVLKDTGNCYENDLKFCSIILYRNQSIDFQPRFSSPLSSWCHMLLIHFYSCNITLWNARQN